MISTIGLCWLTYLYFPICYDLAHREMQFKMVVVAITTLRLFLMGLVGTDWHRKSNSMLRRYTGRVAYARQGNS